jgi:RNA polymerase sigma factor (sigma-70 family)
VPFEHVPFEQVVREHGAVVWRVCRALLPAADADDAWVETFLAAMEAYPRLRADSNITGWLVTIAHRKSIDQLRAAGRRAVPIGDLPEVPNPDDLAVELTAELQSAPDQELSGALAQLPPKQRAAVVGRYLADLSYRDLAEMLGSSEAAARRSAADGIAKLRTQLRADTLERRDD